MIPATDLPVAGLPSMRSNIFSNVASLCDRARDSIEMSFVSCLCVQYVHASGLSTTHNHIGQLVWEPCHNYKVLCPKCSTTAGGHHSCRSNVTRMTCVWWHLTHNITIHTMRLALKERCLKINVKIVPILAGCQLAAHPKSRSCGSRRICLLTILLFVLETSQYPSCLEEVTLFVRLDGKHPHSGYIIPRFDLPQINKIENLIIHPGFVFLVFCFSKLFVTSSYFFG